MVINSILIILIKQIKTNKNPLARASRSCPQSKTSPVHCWVLFYSVAAFLAKKGNVSDLVMSAFCTSNKLIINKNTDRSDLSPQR